MAKKIYPNKRAILAVTIQKLSNIKAYLKTNVKKGELPKNCVVLKGLEMTIGIANDMKKA